MSVPLLSALQGHVNRRLVPEQKAAHGSIGGTNKLSLGSGNQKEREVWGAIETYLEAE